MSGNVWEWTGDLYMLATGVAFGTNREVRGGSWSGVAALARVAQGSPADPAAHNGYGGFRLARSIQAGSDR